MSDAENLFGSDDQDDEEFGRPEQKLGKQRLRPSGGRAGTTYDSAAEQLEDNLDDEAPEERGAYGGSEDEARDDDDEPGPRNAAPAMEIEAPLIALPPAGQLHLVKMSNILGVEPRPFDPDTFTAEEETYMDAAGVRRVKIRDENVIRWRTVRLPDGTEERQSNARLVRWSDGSLQLLLGDEVLDVLQQDTTLNNIYLYCMRNIIQGQAQLTSRLAFRPASLESKLHKRLREAVDKRHGKLTKVAAHAELMNPVKAKEAQEKEAEEKIRSREHLQRRQNRVMDRAFAPRRPLGGSGQRLTSQYLEDDGFIDDDDDDGGPAAADNSRRHQMDEGEAARRLHNAKRTAAVPGVPNKRRAVQREDALPSDEEEEEEEDALSTDGEEEEAEEAPSRQPTRPQPSQAARRPSGGAIALNRTDDGRSAVAAAAAAKMKARRGVVLSDDEDE